jgi:hypothetical protein
MLARSDGGLSWSYHAASRQRHLSLSSPSRACIRGCVWSCFMHPSRADAREASAGATDPRAMDDGPIAPVHVGCGSRRLCKQTNAGNTKLSYHCHSRRRLEENSLQLHLRLSRSIAKSSGFNSKTKQPSSPIPPPPHTHIPTSPSPTRPSTRKNGTDCPLRRRRRTARLWRDARVAALAARPLAVDAVCPGPAVAGSPHCGVPACGV